jgi:hypothetical protein
MLRGSKKYSEKAKPKVALTSAVVAKMIKSALAVKDVELATIMAISRLFMLRVPSECLPLAWASSHSSVRVEENKLSITLTKRKNNAHATTLIRPCVCATQGDVLCPLHLLRRLHPQARNGRLFTMTASRFLAQIRWHAEMVKFSQARLVGTHSFRRGLAQDIVDKGGSLATLLKAGGWTSSAFQVYLREEQIEDTVVGQFLVDLSESEAEL